MVHALLLALALSAEPAAAPAAPAAPATISLGVGSQKIISTSGLKWTAVTDDKVAEVKPIGGKQVLVVGVGWGRTRLLIATEAGKQLSYEVTVRKEEGCGIFEIKKLLGDMQGVESRMVGDRIYLEGAVRSVADASRVRQITALYPNVKSFVKADPAAVDQAVRDANAALAKQGLSRVKATAAGGHLFLEGEVEDRADALKAEALVKPVRELLEVDAP
jgi:Flp pilus assembly secretin CpaC